MNTPAHEVAAGQARNVAARRFRERSIITSLILCGVFSLLTTASIIGVLATETVRFFQYEDVRSEFSALPGETIEQLRAEGIETHAPVATVGEFFTDLQWNPLLGTEKNFGIWPLINGTLLVTLIAMIVALPLGLITAIWLSEYAPDRLRRILKPVLEVIAGVPTVVFGFFALTFITPAIRFEFMESINNPFGVGTYNALSAGIAVGILCLPIVTSLSEDAIRAVPKSLREGAYGLGATRFETSTKVVLPAALSGIIAAFLLAVARAVGETMIVALAAGASPMPLNNIADPPIVQPDVMVIADAESRDIPIVTTDAAMETADIAVADGQGLGQISMSYACADPNHIVRIELLRVDDNVSDVIGERWSCCDATSSFIPTEGLDEGTYRVRVIAHESNAPVEVNEITAVIGDRASIAASLATPIDVRKEIQPMTGYMVQIFLGDASNFGPEYLSSYAVAATLFVMTLILTLIGHRVRVRYRQVYD